VPLIVGACARCRYTAGVVLPLLLYVLRCGEFTVADYCCDRPHGACRILRYVALRIPLRTIVVVLRVAVTLITVADFTLRPAVFTLHAFYVTLFTL